MIRHVDTAQTTQLQQSSLSNFFKTLCSAFVVVDLMLIDIVFFDRSMQVTLDLECGLFLLKFMTVLLLLKLFLQLYEQRHAVSLNRRGVFMRISVY